MSNTRKLFESFNKYLNEEQLDEKINKDNQEINDKIRKALRSKGEARKLEPELDKYGIKVNYDQSQGTTMTGPNGKKLRDDKNNIYGPSNPGFNDTHIKHDNWDDKRAIDTGNMKKNKELELKQLEVMDRDDIIRKYNDLSTDEALKKHQETIDKVKNDIEYWAKEEKEYSDNAVKRRERERGYRKSGHERNPESNYRHPMSKNKISFNKDSAVDKVDYLNYLTKKDTGARVRDNSWNDGNMYDPELDMNKNLKGYKDLKQKENWAQDDLRFKKDYYGVKSDDELEKQAADIRAKAEKDIADAKEKNEKNKASTADAQKRVDDAIKAKKDYLDKIRAERNKK